jgi:nucleoid DNA-binding protein
MARVLTKKDLAKQAAKALHIPQTKALNAVETLADLIACHFQEGGERVTIRGFGTIKLRKRCAFTGRDPRTRELFTVKARKSITFKPSRELLDRINLYK